MWTGRQPHNLPHVTNGIDIIGAISNYEGLGLENTTFDRRKLSDELARAGYDVQVLMLPSKRGAARTQHLHTVVVGCANDRMYGCTATTGSPST